MFITTPRQTYKPFLYPWAYDYYVKQSRELFWKPEAISFSDDLKDYNRIPPVEREFISRILTFFTQADVDISQHYVSRYLPAFPHPELRMMLLAFANMESTHIDAYSKLVDTLGLGDYESFLAYPEMKEKHEYLNYTRAKTVTPSQLMYEIAIGSAFGEGLQLFGTFAMLLSYSERGLFKGMTDVVQWSLRDESLHVKGMVKIFHELRKEIDEDYWGDTKRSIYEACRDMVELEDRFISLVYADGLELPNLNKADIHQYIRFLADYRLEQLGLKPMYYVDKNPLESLMGLFTSEIHEDYFSGTVTSYQHTSFNTEELW